MRKYSPQGLLRRAKKIALQWRATRHRKKLGKVSDTQWIAITGSCGKSTTARILSMILSRHGRCAVSDERHNYTGTVPQAILKVDSQEEYVVQEIGTHVPGSIAKLCKMVQPQIGLITNVGTDHYTQFGSEDAIANEKADLVRSLPAKGIAILNSDDPRVAAMRSETKARVVSYSEGNASADYVAMEVSSSWPQPLTFVLKCERGEYRVTTQLFGKHLVSSVLASLACAIELGVPAEVALEVIKDVAPVEGRMSRGSDGKGVSFIRDDVKAPWWALPFTKEFLEDAVAKRKILVIGEMSDNPGNKKRKFSRFLTSMYESVDLIAVVGPGIRKVNKTVLENDKVMAFGTVKEASLGLDEVLRAGDLVVLKGMIGDHLERIYHARNQEVGCWQTRCGLSVQCSKCEQLSVNVAPAESSEALESTASR